MTKVPDGPWYYEQLNLGLNYRMNDVQAALGLSQMSRMNGCRTRNEIAVRYMIAFDYSSYKKFSKSQSSWHLYIIRLKNNKSISHRQLFEKFRAANLVNIHYIQFIDSLFMDLLVL